MVMADYLITATSRRTRFATMVEERIGGLLVSADPFFNSRRSKSSGSQCAIGFRQCFHGGNTLLPAAS